MEVNAKPVKRNPITATFPLVAVKSAEPRLPAMPDKAGSVLNTASVLLFGCRKTAEVAMVAPVVSRSVIVTVVASYSD